MPDMDTSAITLNMIEFEVLKNDLVCLIKVTYSFILDTLSVYFSYCTEITVVYHSKKNLREDRFILAYSLKVRPIEGRISCKQHLSIKRPMANELKQEMGGGTL